MTKINLAVDIQGLRLENPVLTASGTYGFGLEYSRIINVCKLGAIVTKGLTLEPRKGNPGIRLFETPAGLLNSIGLENPGVDNFIKEYLPQVKKLGPKIIANISGNTIEDYIEIAERLGEQEGIGALEVNISCPNVKAGGMAFGTNCQMAASVTKAVRGATTLPVIVKLSPNVTDITEIALAVEEAGADAVSLINTLLGLAIDINSQKPILGNIVGGFSGPAVKPVALRAVWQVAQRVKIPVIGIGGISTWQDAIEFILAGASAITVGTANFYNPQAPLEILTGIENYCYERGISDIAGLVGKAWKEG